MDRRETERFLDAVRGARESGEPAAIATVVRVHGSAYRREGTRMLVRRDGTYECALSGGCLEPAVANAAAQVIATGRPTIVSFDLADDSIWGLGIGCAGAVDIRIERLDDDPIVQEWLGEVARGAKAVLVTPLSGASGRLLVRPDRVTGRLHPDDIQMPAIVAARARLESLQPQSASESTGGIELFYEVAFPPPHLVIFGGGFDAVPVAHLAFTLGFAVTVVDPRATFLTAERFPGATLAPVHFSEFAGCVKIDARSYVVIMNHHLERDRQSLRFAIQSEAMYVGVLGPRPRFEKLLADLADDGFVAPAGRLARVRSPVGLAVGAETPAEVALSILGEILAIERGFDAGFLSGRTASLHRSDTARLLASS